MKMKKRILFFCETVTLAHFIRSHSLIKSLAGDEYEIHLAAGEIPPSMLAEVSSVCQVWPLPSAIASKVFLQALAQGRLPYSRSVVESQVQEDFELIQKVKPDLVVGDFRLSLAISARVAKVPYINISNITWHPKAKISPQVPDLKIVRTFGETFSLFISKLVRPWMDYQFLKPFSKVAKQYGRPSFRGLFHLYVDGDYVLYSDTATLAPVPDLRENEIIAGPIFSSIAQSQSEIPDMDPNFPNVVISLGSSGNQECLPIIIKAFQDLPVNLFVSTAGSPTTIQNSKNLFVAPYLPLDSLLEKATVFVCSGGSASGYISLKNGVPMLAIPSNLDQFHFTSLVCEHGAALRLRIEEINQSALQEALGRLLSEPSFRHTAKRFGKEIQKENANRKFQELTQSVLRGEKL
jgi:UDP:flavonoid glycosyltransferase YjiC (YdhE family)